MRLEVIKQMPRTTPKRLPLLFVHGAWHGAWCWDDEFLPYFARFQYDAYALSLRGHGNSEGREKLRWYSVNDYVEDVARIADDIARDHRRRPVIVGHSLGGYVTQKFLEKHRASGAILLASVPTHGLLPLFSRRLFTHPRPTLNALLTMDASKIIGSLELMHEAFFSKDTPYHRLERYYDKLGGESFRMLLDAGVFRLPRPKRIKHTPVLVIGAENDAIFTVNEVERTARAYGTQAYIIPDTAHDIMLEPNWKQAADIMLKWLENVTPVE